MGSYGKPLAGAIVAAGYGKQTEAAVMKIASSPSPPLRQPNAKERR
jgi:hypothetical protein